MKRKTSNEDVFFDIVNRYVSTENNADQNLLPKLTTPNLIKIFPREEEFVFRNSSSLCLVYTLWEHLPYLKLAYLSLISQAKFTDALNYDVRFYVHEKLYPYAVKILGSIIDKSKVIKVKNQDYMRYHICTFLQEEYETIIFCDSDSFMLGNPENNFYGKLQTLSRERHRRLLCKAPIVNIRETIEHRRTGRMAEIAENREEMLSFFSRVTGMKIDQLDRSTSSVGRWPLGGFHVVGNHLFRDDREDFLLWSKIFKAIDFPCDETFWKLWSEKYQYEIYDLEENGKLFWAFDLEKEDYYTISKAWLNDGTTHFFHPFVGRDCDYPQLTKFFEWIQKC